VTRLDFPPEAVWIGSGHPFDLHEAYLCFRSPAAWRLAQKPAQASLYITADSRYKLWVNSQFVARGPARSYPQFQSVDCLDLTACLQPGSNTLAVQVYQPGYSHFAYVHRGAAGLLAHLVCDGQTSLVSDLSWRVRRDPSFAANVPRVSIYGSGVEARDLWLAGEWIAPDYDDSGWTAPRLVAPTGGYPWLELRLRPVPLLAERELPMTLLQTRRLTTSSPHRLTPPSDAHLALRQGWFLASPTEPFPAESGWFTASLAAGESTYWLFDLGRDYTCQGWAEIKGAGSEELLAVSYHEKIRQGEPVISDPETYCRVRLTDHFHLRPGHQTAETFALRGGRYLIFQLTGPTGSEFQFQPQARIAEYPLEVTRPLSTGDPQLDKIITLCEDTFRACLQDGFVDCVWRESSQWLGDALPQSLIMSALSDDTRPLRQVIEMAAQGVYPDGVLPGVLPGEVHAYVVVDYNFIWVELLSLYWKRCGSDGLVETMWPVLCNMLDRFHQDGAADGLLISQPGRRLFLDWAPLSRNEPNAVYNLHYLLALQKAVELAQGRGLITDETRRWQSRAAELQRAIRSTFWHAGRWYDDPQRTTFSQLAAALTVLTQTAVAGEVETLLAAVVERSLDPGDDPAPDRMVLASPFMHHYIFEALRQHRRFEAIIEIIRCRWGRWVEAGCPTTWENWNVDFPDGSQCHAFSAHPRYHLAEIAKAGGL
jgi:hypothetical protein